MKSNCANCRAEIKTGEAYRHLKQMLCEDCYMDIKMPRKRKTHWQYLKSIKTEYLKDG